METPGSGGYYRCPYECGRYGNQSDSGGSETGNEDLRIGDIVTSMKKMVGKHFSRKIETTSKTTFCIITWIDQNGCNTLHINCLDSEPR